MILEKPDPAYTEEARRNKTKGTVVFSVMVDKDGRVTEITPLKRLPDGLTGKAIEAAGALRFQPAEVDGHAVSIVRIVEYVCSLE